jgi:AcrR family transcriptional regulator
LAYRSTQRTEARLAEARERITTAARELIAEGGYAAAQVAPVADRAGVAVGTVYRHFPSKSDLFAEVFREASQHEVDAMRAAMEVGARARDSATRSMKPAAERIAAGIEAFARRALRGKRLAWALLAEPVDPAVEAERLEFRHSYRDLMAEVIREGIAAGDLPAQDADATAAALIGAIGEAMLGPLSPTHAYNGSFQDKTGRSNIKRVAPLGAPSHHALASRPRTTDPDALIASLISFCTRAIGEERASVDA